MAGLATATAAVTTADTVVEIKPAAMTYTNSAAPTKVYSTYADSILSKSQYMTYLKFDTSKIAASSKIVSAELQTRVNASQATTPAFSVASADASKNYGKMSYSTRPAATSARLNPNDATTASTGKTVTTKLTGLSSSNPASWLGLQVGYTASYSAVHLSKTTQPVLRLTVRAAVPRLRPS